MTLDDLKTKVQETLKAANFADRRRVKIESCPINVEPEDQTYLLVSATKSINFDDLLRSLRSADLNVHDFREDRCIAIDLRGNRPDEG